LINIDFLYLKNYIDEIHFVDRIKDHKLNFADHQTDEIIFMHLKQYYSSVKNLRMTSKNFTSAA